MKRRLGHSHFVWRICVRSRGFARFAARVPRTLDRSEIRRRRQEIGDGETARAFAFSQGICRLAASAGMMRQVGAEDF